MFLRGRGTIAMQGLFAFSRKGPHEEPALAIIGGTGWYAHASGTATVVEHFLRIDMR
jgi:purine nucleoside phosphorylase